MKIEIWDKVINKLRNAFFEEGLDIPETLDEWTETINILLEEKIVDDYGDV